MAFKPLPFQPGISEIRHVPWCSMGKPCGFVWNLGIPVPIDYHDPSHGSGHVWETSCLPTLFKQTLKWRYITTSRIKQLRNPILIHWTCSHSWGCYTPHICNESVHRVIGTVPNASGFRGINMNQHGSTGPSGPSHGFKPIASLRSLELKIGNISPKWPICL